MAVEERPALQGSVVALPLVSLVVVNWNYAAYIGETIDSIRRQDYPDFEVVVLDNASTDASRDVIERHVDDDERFTVVHVDQNLGQLGGVMRALPYTAGDFVSIVDSDDILHPDFVSMHVQTHLALPVNVALTSSNIVEMDAVGRALTGHYEAFNRVDATRTRGLRRPEGALRVGSVSDERYHELSRAVSVHEAGGGWVWGPGTSNMYRRSVLELVSWTPPGGRWMRAADNYLNPICHLFGGSALIDLPLSAYRVHGSNYFCERETLHGVLKGRAEIVARSLDLHTESCDIFLRKSAILEPVLAHRFWWAFDQLSAQLRGPTGQFLSTPSVLAVFADNYGVLLDTFGPDVVRTELGSRLTSRDLYAVVRRSGQVRPASLDLLAHQGSPARTAVARAVRVARRYGDVPLRGVPRTVAGDVRRAAVRTIRPTVPAPAPAPASPPPDPEPACDSRSTEVAYGDRLGYGPASVLSVDPPVFLTGMAFKEYVGLAGAFGRKYGDEPAGFVIYPTWSIGSPAVADQVIRRARAHAARYPAHRLVFLCNTAEERDRLVAGGLTAELLNKNFFASESDFFPRDDIAVEFDAVYNARFDPNKRHELAGGIGSVAYLTYDDPANTSETRRVQQELLAATLAAHPHHALLNPTDDGVPVRLPPQGVNAALNRAAVGLCLSAVEGANYASVEYLLAGLPVVSTPSTGGRDVYFDHEFCVIADPTPEAVRDAVEALRTRRIPPGYIRERTLAKLEPRRRRFLELVDDVREELGGARRHVDGVWPFTSMGELVTWQEHWRHLAGFEQVRSAASGRPPEPEATFDRLLDAGSGMQLEVTELRPIVEAVQVRPGCRLLVFGCGHDSAFWEAVNGGGTTVFLEDDPAWADQVRPSLQRSTIHLVEYGTVLDDWPTLLHQPDRLGLDLPDEVTATPWDVILVDAPPGYPEHVRYTGREAPGRMKSIYTASRLVAPGGVVFVHDAERQIERVYADHYLGSDRLFERAVGHAVLLGYQF